MAIPLTAITRIEQEMVDRILESAELPPNVLVQRLADSIEKTGVISNSSMVTIKYTGQNASLKNRSPLVTENTLNFEVEVQTQQYFTHNGHDAALRLLIAVKNALTNFMPMNTGIFLEYPLNFSSESFLGITENSEFVYKLSFNTVAQFTWPLLANDPCKQRGSSCEEWPGPNVVLERPPNSAVDPLTREIYVLRDPDSFPHTEKKLTLVSTDPPIIRNDDTGETTTLVDKLNVKLFELRLLMYRSPESRIGSGPLVYTKDITEFTWEYARAQFIIEAYIDPLISTEVWKTYPENTLFKINPGVTLTISGTQYTMAQFNNSPKVWVVL